MSNCYFRSCSVMFPFCSRWSLPLALLDQCLPQNRKMITLNWTSFVKKREIKWAEWWMMSQMLVSFANGFIYNVLHNLNSVLSGFTWKNMLFPCRFHDGLKLWVFFNIYQIVYLHSFSLFILCQFCPVYLLFIQFTECSGSSEMSWRISYGLSLHGMRLEIRSWNEEDRCWKMILGPRN